MRLSKLPMFLAVSVFLIGSLAATSVLADGVAHQVADHETRITNLELQPPGAGIGVFDANGQYLGILVSDQGSEVLVFILNLKNITKILKSDGTIFRGTRDVLYDYANCTGNAYVQLPYNNLLNGLIHKFGERYYTGGVPQQETVNVISRLVGNECKTEPDVLTADPVIEVLEEDIPFTLPIAIPLRYEY